MLFLRHQQSSFLLLLFLLRLLLLLFLLFLLFLRFLGFHRFLLFGFPRFFLLPNLLSLDFPRESPHILRFLRFSVSTITLLVVSRGSLGSLGSFGSLGGPFHRIDLLLVFRRVSTRYPVSPFPPFGLVVHERRQVRRERLSGCVAIRGDDEIVVDAVQNPLRLHELPIPAGRLQSLRGRGPVDDHVRDGGIRGGERGVGALPPHFPAKTPQHELQHSPRNLPREEEHFPRE